MADEGARLPQLVEERRCDGRFGWRLEVHWLAWLAGAGPTLAVDPLDRPTRSTTKVRFRCPCLTHTIRIPHRHTPPHPSLGHALPSLHHTSTLTRHTRTSRYYVTGQLRQLTHHKAS